MCESCETKHEEDQKLVKHKLEEGGKMKEVRCSHQGAILPMVLVIFPNVKKF